MSTDPTTELVLSQGELAQDNLPSISRPAQQLLDNVLGVLGGASIHNFDGNRFNQWRLSAIATGPLCKPFDPATTSEIEVRYFYAHRVELRGETAGEIIDAVRCVLITPELVAYQFMSEGIARDIAGLIQVFGLSPFDPPINVRIVQVSTRRGFRTYRIVPV